MSTNSIKSYRMYLQYYLTKGHTQNLLIDTIDQKLYYLPKTLDSVEDVVQDYTAFQQEDFQPFSMETFTNQWLEFIEVELSFEYLEDVMTLAANSLADFLLIRVANQEELERIVVELNDRLKKGTLSLRQASLVIDFEPKLDHLLVNPSGFIAILDAKLVASLREVALQNFSSAQPNIIQSKRSNVFYHGRLYIDRSGFIKSHAESDCQRFHISEYALKHKELVADEELTQNWSITKDQIQGCRVCEYRNVCIDADPLVRLDDGSFQRSQPCAYDPLSGKWKSEAEEVLKHELKH